jgi:hypothetical protein
MRDFDFSSWQTVLSTFVGLALITLIGVGIRLLVMQTVQQRRERENRQINERLRTLIAAYKTLGGSFTGDLAVDPAHLRDVLRRQASPAEVEGNGGAETELRSSERSRRIRDAVEAALSDVILLGTEEQVRLAVAAATDLVAGRAVHTHELVVSLRNFIRQVLDLDAVPGELAIPRQGPARPSASGGRGAGRGDAEGKSGGTQGGGRGGAGNASAGTGAGLGMGMGLGLGSAEGDEESGQHR